MIGTAIAGVVSLLDYFSRKFFPVWPDYGCFGLDGVLLGFCGSLLVLSLFYPGCLSTVSSFVLEIDLFLVSGSVRLAYMYSFIAIFLGQVIMVVIVSSFLFAAGNSFPNPTMSDSYCL